MIRALRLFSLVLSVLPIFVATAAASPFSEWRPRALAALVLVVGLLHAAANLLNDYFDFLSGVDWRVDGDDGRPGRVLVRGDLAPRAVFIEGAACLALAAGATAYLAWESGWPVAWFVGAGMFALYAYTGPPFRLKYRALGEPVIFLVFGPLLVTCAAYAQTGRWDLPILLLSVPVGVATTAVLLGNNIRDEDEDGAAGITTFVHMVGPKAAKAVYVFGVIGPPLGVAGLVFAGVLPTGALFCLASLVPAGLVVRKVLKDDRVPNIDALTVLWEAVFLIALLFGIVLS
jgi:1,4-dihydroxy-2-naphthoate octaprenyltransferase